MIEISIEGPDQETELVEATVPCTLGRHADNINPSLSINDPFVSRTHVELDHGLTGMMLVKCVGRSAIWLSNGNKLETGEQATVPLPIEISLGRSVIVIRQSNPHSMSVLGTPPAALGPTSREMTQLIFTSTDDKVTSDQLINWFQSLISLQENAIGRTEFFRQAAIAVVEMIGLDRCVLLGRNSGRWTIETQHGELQLNETTYSQSVVSSVLEHKKTVFDQSVQFEDARSLAGVSAFVGSPILGADGDVIGCLFGSRRIDPQKQDEGVSPMQAQLVQLVAGIVSSRLARMDAEAEQTRAQVQLEQFASPALVREMQDNPQWLDAQQRELTMLFGDIRGFSTLSERLSAADLCSFVRDTMDCLTPVIMRHGGFVFNYAGDGIAAMWNAPSLSSSHAVDACRAAVEMQESLLQLEPQWGEQIGGPVRVGIGVHTGKAMVGNSGSQARLHYSPLGRSVNLASRLEGATKYFGVKILISQFTADALDEQFAKRDLGKIRVVGIDHSVRVFELASPDRVTHEWESYRVLRHMFESQDQESIQNYIDSLPATHDGPTKCLLKQIQNSENPGDTVWRLDRK